MHAVEFGAVEADEAVWFRFRVGGRRWRVLLVHPEHEALEDEDDERVQHAVTDREKRVIYADATRSARLMTDDVIHELGHAAFWDLLPEHLYDHPLRDDIEEVLIRTMVPLVCRLTRPRLPPFPPEARALIRAARRKVRAA
jgi:hypothetical protein